MMEPEFALDYLSYSSRTCYITCPKKYYFKYIVKVKVVEDPKNKIFGIAIGKAFEWFYKEAMWSWPDLDKEIGNLIDKSIDHSCSRTEFDPNSNLEFIANVHNDLNKYVPLTIDVIRKHHLLSLNSHSEVKLDITYRSPKNQTSIKLGGRADFIHYKDDGVWILDGKGSRYREQYVDSGQLIWYATQHFIKYHVAPTRLGFLFYKFPDDPLQWIQYSSESIKSNIDLTFDVMKKINLKNWMARPSNACYKCEYKSQCPDGEKFIASEKAQIGSVLEPDLI